MHILTIMPDGVRIPVRAEETLLQAAHRFGYAFSIGCRQGGCGICLLPLLSGQVHYAAPVAETVLSEQQRAEGICLPCRAIPETDVVIRLSKSDRLKRGPFSDRLALRALERAQVWKAQPE